MTIMQTVDVDLAKTTLFPLEFVPNNFNEFRNLAPNFEAYKFYRAKITVYPEQNVSNNSSSVMPTYCLFPWKKQVPATYTFNDFLSIDKCKVARGTACLSQSYVPSVLSTVQYQPKTGAPATSTTESVYKPRIELVDDNSYLTNFYCGCAGFQACPPAPGGAKAHYNIRWDVWAVLYNQKTMK